MKKRKQIEVLLLIAYAIFLLATPFSMGYFHTKITPFFFGIVLFCWFLFFLWSLFQKRKPTLFKIEYGMLLLPFLYLIPYLFHFDFFPNMTLLFFGLSFGIMTMVLIYRQVFGICHLSFLGHVLLVSVCLTILLSLLYFSYPNIFSNLGYQVQYADFYPTSVNRLYGPFAYPNMFALWSFLGAFLSMFFFLKTNKKIYAFLCFFCLFGSVLGCSKMLFFFAFALLILYHGVRWKHPKTLQNMDCVLISALLPCLFLWNAFHEYMFHSNFTVFFASFLLGSLFFFLCLRLLQTYFKVASACLLLCTLTLFFVPIPKDFHITSVVQEKNQYLLDLVGLKKNHSYQLQINLKNKGMINDSHLRLAVFYLDESEQEETVTRIPLDQSTQSIRYTFQTKENFEYYFLQWIHIGYGNDLWVEPVTIVDLETMEKTEFPLSYVLMPYPLMMQEKMRIYDQGSVVGRTQIYRDAWMVHQAHPIVGQGGHAFYHYLLKNQYPHHAAEEHSYWFQLLVEVGWLGVFLFLFLLLSSFALLLRIASKGSFLVVALFLFLLGTITFDVTMSYGITYFCFFFLIEYLIEQKRLIQKNRVMMIASAGGHLTELLELKPLFLEYQTCLVTEKNAISSQLSLPIPIYYLHYCSRFYWVRYLWYAPLNILRSTYYFFRFQPDLIYTTGAHTSVWMCYLAWFFDRKIIFVEVYDRTYTPTLSGRLIYPIASKFFVQQKPLLNHYKKAQYRKGVYE